MIIFQQSPQVIDGGQQKSVVTNFYEEELLEKVLTELRKMNLNISLAYNNFIEDDDVKGVGS